MLYCLPLVGLLLLIHIGALGYGISSPADRIPVTVPAPAVIAWLLRYGSVCLTPMGKIPEPLVGVNALVRGIGDGVGPRTSRLPGPGHEPARRGRIAVRRREFRGSFEIWFGMRLFGHPVSDGSAAGSWKA